MITQHNISAVNSYRSLGTNQSALDKNSEEPSSGYKINRTNDNAAGLAISEGMRSQINGLNQAPANAKDTIDLTKAAEDALSEAHSMLQRMTTLVEQAANGTYNTVARGSIQEEYKALTKEIKRISENADFDGIKPPTTGKEMTVTSQIGPTLGETITVDKEDIYGGTATAAMSLGPSIQDDAKSALKTIKTAIDNVLTYRVKLDAARNHLEHTVRSLGIMSENIIETESRIHDIDMADGITAFTESNILL